jgi:sarcosine oxidase/L-pipecolate oxidase
LYKLLNNYDDDNNNNNNNNNKLSQAFDSVIHDRLFTNLAASGVVSTVVVWVRELLVGRTQRVRLGGQISKEVKIISVAPEGSVLGSLLFPVYVNDIWRNIDSSIRLFAADCKIYRNDFLNKKLP